MIKSRSVFAFALSIFVLVPTIVSVPSVSAFSDDKVQVRVCNNSDIRIRFAWLAVNDNNMEDAWGNGFVYANPGECSFYTRWIWADNVYFAFLNVGEDFQYFKPELTGLRREDVPNPVKEMCVTTDGWGFYYEPQLGEYQGGKVVKCTDKVSRSSSDRNNAVTTRNMQVAEVAAGVVVRGENFLTLNVSKAESLEVFDVYDPASAD